LGTGTSQGIPVIGCKCEVCQSKDRKDKRLRSSVALMKDSGNIVIDTGPDFRMQMLHAEIDQLSAALITHEHNDHIAGLDDIRPFNFMNRSALRVYARARVAEQIKHRFAYIFSNKPYPGAPQVELEQFENNVVLEIDGFKIFPIEYYHGKMPVSGFICNQMAYLTDVKTIPQDQKQYLKGLRVLVISALHKDPHFTHLNLDEALELIDELKPEMAYLTHVSHRMGKHELVDQTLPEAVKLAFDGLEIDLIPD
jgi:phosphoribosyl 1,2-cyclic phosphate phosphodiesterase